jgi:hypothetical protein
VALDKHFKKIYGPRGSKGCRPLVYIIQKHMHIYIGIYISIDNRPQCNLKPLNTLGSKKYPLIIKNIQVLHIMLI